MTTLEETARATLVKFGLTDYATGEPFADDLQVMTAFLRSAQVEALERAAEQAEGLTKKFGNPNGSPYNQGQNDMGFRVVSNLRAEAERVRNGGTI